jgi:uncharacterized protein
MIPATHRRPVLLLVSVALLTAARVAVAREVAIPPAPTRWVTDTAGFLRRDAVERLDARLASYQRTSGHQVVVWIGTSTGDIPLDDYANRTFEAWRLGRKGVEDGLLVMILATDRKVAIEVGYGLEDRITDAHARRIIDDVLTPGFRAGEQERALTAAIDALIARIEGEAAPAGEEPAQPRGQPSLWQLVVGGIGLLLFLFLLVTNPGLALLLLHSIMSGRGNGRSGGGFGGGGFRGGGGLSGGGGARGSW